MKRVEAVRRYRLASSAPTRGNWLQPHALFGEIRQPTNDYLLIPKASSERRTLYSYRLYVNPILSQTTCYLRLPDARHYHFGVLSSAMHMAWVRAVCGRLKSDYRYSAGIVYNNFPWPQNPTDKQQQAIEAAAQAVLGCPGAISRILPRRPLRPPDHAAGIGQGPPEVGCRG